jgi:hypothetical protein
MENGWKLTVSMEIRHSDCLLMEDLEGFEASIEGSGESRWHIFGSISDALLWLTSFQPIYGNVDIPGARTMDKIKTAVHMTARALTLRPQRHGVSLFRRLFDLLTEYVAENQPMTPESFVEFGRIADDIPFDVPHLDSGVIDQLIATYWR